LVEAELAADPVDGFAAGDDDSFLAELPVVFSDEDGAEESDFSLGLRSRFGLARFESDLESLL
jgi:hypothetical protein